MLFGCAKWVRRSERGKIVGVGGRCTNGVPSVTLDKLFISETTANYLVRVIRVEIKSHHSTQIVNGTWGGEMPRINNETPDYRRCHSSASFNFATNSTDIELFERQHIKNHLPIFDIKGFQCNDKWALTNCLLSRVMIQSHRPTFHRKCERDFKKVRRIQECCPVSNGKAISTQQLRWVTECAANRELYIDRDLLHAELWACEQAIYIGRRVSEATIGQPKCEKALNFRNAEL